MARPRRRATQQDEGSTATATPEVHTTTNTGDKMTDLMFEQLTDEEIGEALSSQRSKGEYKAILQQIVEGGVRAARIPTDRGPFEGRKASTVKTGFENARKADDAPEEFKQLKVSSKKGNVYIVNTAEGAS